MFLIVLKLLMLTLVFSGDKSFTGRCFDINKVSSLSPLKKYKKTEVNVSL